MTSPIEWNVIATDGRARAGMLRTRRGNIETPVFMPVGTQGAIKGVRFEWLENEFDARIILVTRIICFCGLALMSSESSGACTGSILGSGLSLRIQEVFRSFRSLS